MVQTRSYWVVWPALGQWLRDARSRTSLTQREVGQAVGSDARQYSFYERGHRRPSRERLVKLAALLHLDRTEALVLAGYAVPEEG